MIDIQLVTQTGLMLLVVLLIGYLSEKIGFINKDFTTDSFPLYDVYGTAVFAVLFRRRRPHIPKA